VDTTAISTDGTPSVAVQSASSGYATQVTVNGETYTAVEPQMVPEQQNAPVVPDLESVPTAAAQAANGWDTAPSCTSIPDQSNSVIDQSGRLWGWENSQVKFICNASASLLNVVPHILIFSCSPVPTRRGLRMRVLPSVGLLVPMVLK
jgi:hypothetical protein